MKTQHYLKSIITVVVLTLLVGMQAFAQLPKRNLIVNSNFEEGLKNWRWDGMLDDAADDVAVVSVEETNPISGTKSAKVEVFKKVQDPWQVQLYTFVPIEEYAKYKIQFKAKASVEDAKFKIEICESYDNQTAFKPIDIEEWNHDIFTIDNPDINDLRGTLTVGTEVQDFEFITAGNQFSYPNYIVAFHFGHATENVTFWIDDVRISRCDEGDWDGNMFPVGNFESDRVINFNNQGYYIDGRTANPESVAYLTTGAGDAISGNKSFYIYKAPGENHGGFWELSYHFQLWHNDATKLDVSLKGKSTKAAKFMMRVTGHPWGWGGGDWYQWVLPFTTEVQTIRPDRNMAIGWHGKNDGVDYGSVQPLAYGWDPIARTGYRGRLSIFGSLLDNEAGGDEYKTSDDTGFWIDDVVIKEANLYLNKFDVEYAPAEVEIGKTAQFKIGDFVMPTHAPTELDFWVENGTGEATIDDDLVLTGVKAGTVKVFFDTPNMTDEHEFTVNVVPSSGVNILNEAVVRLSSTIVNAGELIEVKSPIQISFDVYDVTGSLIGTYGHNEHHIRTTGLASGTYLVKIKTDSNLNTVRRFIVK